MVKIREAVVVEGRYDKNTLSQIIDAPIFQTNGFSVMNDREQLELLRRVARERGLIVLTDSDGAGFVIRNFLKSAIPAQQLKNAYIPEISGKERRKKTPGKEGILGVEGMNAQILLECLRKAGATMDDSEVCEPRKPVTKQDLFEMGLSGGANSSMKRKQLLQHLQLPSQMSANAMLQALNLLYTKDEVYKILESL